VRDLGSLHKILKPLTYLENEFISTCSKEKVHVFFHGICDQWSKLPQVVGALFAGAVIVSWCNFISVIYVGE